VAQLGVLEVKVQPDLTGFGSQVSSAMGRIGGAMVGIGKTVAGDLASIGASVATASGLAVGGLATIGIRTAASLETAELQFKVLLGSADEAKTRVAELFEFARTTPFAADEIIKASRTMQIFGGDALATKENLELVGDAAAGVGANIDEVSFWVSRAYALMKAGQPWGEAALRLQELGVLSGDARLQIEQLADAGASSADQWAVFTDDLGRYSGAMDELQNTFEGLWNTLKDTVNISLAGIFQPAFESLKDLMGALRDASDSAAFPAFLEGLSVLMSPVNALFAKAADAVKGFGKAVESGAALDALSRVAGVMDKVAANAGGVIDALGPVIPILAGVAVALASTYAAGLPLIGLLLPQRFSPVTGALIGLVAASDAARDSLVRFGSAMAGAVIEALPQMTDGLQTIVDVLGNTLAGALDAITPALEAIIGVLPEVVDALAAVAAPAGDIVVALAEIASVVIAAVVPALGALLDVTGGVLGAALGLVADALGVVAANADLVVPAIAGLAGAFAYLKVSQISVQLLAFTTSIGGLGPAARGAELAVAGSMDAMRQRVGTAMTGLKSAVGGFAGAFGGLLVGGGIALAIGAITSAMDRQKREAQDTEDAVASYAERIAEVGEVAAAEEMVREFADANEHLQAMLDASGTSWREYAAAMAAGGGEFGAMQERLLGTAAELQRTNDEYDNFGSSTEEVARLSQYLWTEALNPLQRQFANAGNAAEDMATSQDLAAGSSKSYTAAIDSLKFAMDRLNGVHVDVAEAERQTAANMDALTQSFIENGNEMDIATEKGRNNHEAIQTTNEGILAQVEAYAASGMATDEAIAKGTALYDTMVNEVAAGLGISEEAAKLYIAQLGLTPESIRTAAELSTEEANKALSDYLYGLGLTPEDVATLADFNKRGATADWTAYVNNLNLTPKQKETLMKLLSEGALADVATFDQAANQAARDRTARITVETILKDMSFGLYNPLKPAARGVPMMGPGEFGVGTQAADDLDIVLRPRVYAPGLTMPPVPAGADAPTAQAALVIREATFNEPADFDTLLNRMNLALAAGRL